MTPARSDDHEAIQALVARIEEALEGQGRQLGQIHEQVKITNGRVTELERVRAVSEALAIERSQVQAVTRQERAWVPPSMVNAVIFIAGVVVAHFL